MVRHIENKRLEKSKLLRRLQLKQTFSQNKHSIIHDPFLLQCLLNTEEAIIFEVGCNDGSDTLKLLKAFPTAHLYCFEPDPSAIQEFKDNLEENPRCHLFECAIGAESGMATFHQSSGRKPNTYKRNWNLSGSLNTPTGHKAYSPWVKFRTDIEVPVRTLNDIVFSEFRGGPATINLLWMDVQGGEKNVLIGASKILPFVRYIYAEFGHWEKPLYEGQMTLEETIKQLGPDWVPMGIYEGCNLFAVNKTLVRT